MRANEDKRIGTASILALTSRRVCLKDEHRRYHAGHRPNCGSPRRSNLDVQREGAPTPSLFAVSLLFLIRDAFYEFARIDAEGLRNAIQGDERDIGVLIPEDLLDGFQVQS